MAVAPHTASIYDIANLQLAQNWADPILRAQELERQEMLRRQAIQNEAARTFRNQQFQQALQNEQIAGYGANQLKLEAARELAASDRLKAQQDYDQKKLTEVRKTGEESFKSAATNAAQARRLAAKLALQYQDAQEAAIRKLAVEGLGIKPTEFKLTNPKHRAAYETAKLEIGDKPVDIALALRLAEAQKRAQDSERQKNALFDDAIRLGIPAKNLLSAEYIGPEESIDALPLPSGSGYNEEVQRLVGRPSIPTPQPPRYSSASPIELSGIGPLASAAGEVVGRNLFSGPFGAPRFPSGLVDIARKILSPEPEVPMVARINHPLFPPPRQFTPAELQVMASPVAVGLRTASMYRPVAGAGYSTEGEVQPTMITVPPPEFPSRNAVPSRVDALDSVLMGAPLTPEELSGLVTPEELALRAASMYRLR